MLVLVYGEVLEILVVVVALLVVNISLLVELVDREVEYGMDYHNQLQQV